MRETIGNIELETFWRAYGKGSWLVALQFGKNKKSYKYDIILKKWGRPNASSLLHVKKNYKF